MRYMMLVMKELKMMMMVFIFRFMCIMKVYSISMVSIERFLLKFWMVIEWFVFMSMWL